MSVYRTFHTEMPELLIPLYDKQKEVYDFILSDKDIREKLLKIETKQGRGKVWNALGEELNSIIYEELGRNFPNKAWYTRIMYENLRRLLVSYRDRSIIYDILEKYNFEYSPKIWDELYEARIFKVSMTYLKNLIRSKEKPKLPAEATYVMDFSVSNSQMFRDLGNNHYQIKYNKTDWFDFKVLLPLSLRERLTGKTANPRFYLKNGKYVGDISYEVWVPRRLGTTILGIDLGKKKFYSAGALGENGKMHCEYTPSNRILKIQKNYENLLEIQKVLKSKIERVEPYLKGTKVLASTLKKQEERKQKYNENQQKLMNQKFELAKLAAREIVDHALRENAQEIHLEDLRWLESDGGKWNFSAIEWWVQKLAELEGIEVYCVNPKNSSKEHPITEELGKESERDIVFPNKERIDRDRLAHTNLCKRNIKDRPITEVKQMNTRSPRKTKCKRSKRREKAKVREKLGEIKKKPKKEKTKKEVKKEKIEIVVFSPARPNILETEYYERCHLQNLKDGQDYFVLEKGHIFVKQSIPFYPSK